MEDLGAFPPSGRGSEVVAWGPASQPAEQTGEGRLAGVPVVVLKRELPWREVRGVSRGGSDTRAARTTMVMSC